MAGHNPPNKTVFRPALNLMQAGCGKALPWCEDFAVGRAKVEPVPNVTEAKVAV